MRQLLHIFVADPERRAALAGRVGSRWLLPVVGCDERVRGGPLVSSWCRERGVSGEIAGQWLGRISERASDWIVAVAAAPGCFAGDASLQWTPFETLASRDAVLDYQRWAVARVLGDGEVPSVAGAFGNLLWPARVRAWIAEAAGQVSGTLMPYRVSAHEVVLGADTAGGRVYFKGLAGERAAEAQLTQSLAALAPDAFARTLRIEHRRRDSTWWLTAACPGRAATDAHGAAAALAIVQRHAIAAGLDRLALPPLDLESASGWGSEMCRGTACAAMVRDACAAVAGANVVRSWAPMDLDPTNVLVDDEGVVRFIDIDDSYAGPAPLAVAALVRRWGDTAACRTCERVGSPSLSTTQWRQFEVAAVVVQAWLGWKRLAMNVERGEVHAAPDWVQARIRERLIDAIYGR